MNTHKNKIYSFSVLLLLASLLIACSDNQKNTTDINNANVTVTQTAFTSSNGEIQVVISGGHETDHNDHGRPVVLIASMLGVTPEVFREAFSHVSPAGADQEPNPMQVQLNKDALLDALGPYGVTNDHLDEVSNYYRYNRSAGETWPQTPATAEVIMTDGVVTGIEITNHGSGYTSVPTITILNSDLTATAVISFTADFSTNGSISAITLDQ